MPLVVGVVAGVLLLLAGGVGALLLSRHGDSDSAKAAPHVGVSTGPTAGPSTAPSAGVSTGPTTTGGSFACWNGATAANAGACAPVTGTAGLKWVFPSLASTWSQCTPTPLGVKGETRVVAYRCGIDVADGSAVIIYSEYKGAAAVENSYARRYDGAAPVSNGERSQYGPARVAPSGDQAFYSTAVYASADRWAVTAAGPNAQVASEAMATVQMRAHSEVARYE